MHGAGDVEGEGVSWGFRGDGVVAAVFVPHLHTPGPLVRLHLHHVPGSLSALDITILTPSTVAWKTKRWT